MTKENLDAALERGTPFTIHMADGKEYTVPHRDFISFSQRGTSVIVSTADDRFHVLPLLTMTGITQDFPAASR